MPLLFMFFVCEWAHTLPRIESSSMVVSSPKNGGKGVKVVAGVGDGLVMDGLDQRCSSCKTE